MSKRGRDILGPPAGHPDARKTRKQSHLGEALRASGVALRIGTDSMAVVFQFLNRKDALVAIQVCRTWYGVLANTQSLRCNWKTRLPVHAVHTIPPHFRRHIGSIESSPCKRGCRHNKCCLFRLGTRALQTLGTLNHLRCLAVSVPNAPKGPPHATTAAAASDVCAPPQLGTLELSIARPVVGSSIAWDTPDWYITYVLQRLASATTLRRLTIASVDGVEPRSAFSGLQAYTGLQFLDLSECDVDLAGFATIKTCMPDLLELRLEQYIPAEKLEALCSPPHVLTKLTTLHIAKAEVNEMVVRHLSHLTQLAHVDTAGDAWDVDALSVCHLLPRVVSLEIEGWDDEFDVRTFKTYNLRHMESLTLHGLVCYDPRARAADEANRDPSADFFEALTNMPRLHTLILRDCHIPDLARLVHPTLKKLSTYSPQGRFRNSVWRGERG